MGIEPDYDITLSQQNDFSEVRFQKGDSPPPAPTDSFFKFEVTTLYATSHEPFEIGNNLLDFLSGQVVSTLTKVRRPKFSIKADVFADGMMCTLKIRVYGQNPGQFAIEFQRRTGDTLSFNGTFQKAAAFLESQPHLSLQSNEAPAPVLSFMPPELPAGLAEQSVDEVDLQPLLDMTSLVSSPWLQAEAATALSKLAAEGKAAMRTDRVFQGIGELMQSSSTDVAHPTACLVSHLAEQGETATLFASHGLLQKMIDKVHSPQTNVPIRRQFAQALCAAVQWQTRSTLTQDAATSLLHQLSGILNTKDARWGHDVIQNLERAQLTLGRQFEATHWA